MGSALAVAALVFLGGAFGGAARWALTHAMPHPRAGTFTANVAASGIAGFVAAAPEPWHMALGVGFAGALSTWSTHAREVGELLKEREFTEAAYTCLSTLLVSLAAAGFGLMYAARAFYG